MGADGLRRGMAEALAVLLCLALAACGGPRVWRKGGVPGTKPYTVRGKTYVPLKSAHGFVEVGTASWYGPGFHGKTTANGERYNQYALTAAHKLLPLGSTVKVTHLGSQRSVTVRINDRGPFVGDRVIDLSRKSAEYIDMLEDGTARVRVESVGAVPGIRDDGDLEGSFFVQVGSFAVLGNAQRLVKKLRAAGMSARRVRGPAGGLWHVRAGPWPSLYGARKVLSLLAGEHPDAFVVGD